MEGQGRRSSSPAHTYMTVSGGYGTGGGLHKNSEPDISMKKKERLGRYGGKYPSVSLNSNSTAVVVSNSTMGNAMWYWVGRIDEATEEIFGTNGRFFDYGIAPKVALKESGLVIEVHRSQWRHELKYTIGRVAGDFIKWGKHSKYANGTDATVAVNNSNTVVAAHVINKTHIECKVGEVSSKSIQWRDSNTLQGTGTAPCVAINENNTVVIVYQDDSHCRLQCQIGVVNRMAIYWGERIEYANGLNASVCLTTQNRMLVLRQGIHLDELLYGIAKINQETREILEEGTRERCRNQKLCEHKIPTTVSEIALHIFSYPSITMNDQGNILAVYAGNNTDYGPVLWYQLGNVREPLDKAEDDDPPYYYGSDDEQYLSTPPDEC